MLALLLTWPVVLNKLANDIDIQQIYGEIGSDTSGVNESNTKQICWYTCGPLLLKIKHHKTRICETGWSNVEMKLGN